MQAKYILILAMALILIALIVSVVCMVKQGVNYLLIFNAIVLCAALCLMAVGMNKMIPSVDSFVNSLNSSSPQITGEDVDSGEDIETIDGEMVETGVTEEE